jgi:methionyl-tRNA formyltransferase
MEAEAIRWVLLCEPEDTASLCDALAAAGAPTAAICVVHDRTGLEAAVDRATDGRAGGGPFRLIAFHTNIIVPAALLARCPGPSYNFHPGPPAYPGRYPAAFALYDGATTFGATAHEMIARVDAGPIVAACAFRLPPGYDLPWLIAAGRRAAHALFRQSASALADLTRSPARTDLTWGERRCTRAALAAMWPPPPDCDVEETARRARAFAPLASVAAVRIL